MGWNVRKHRVAREMTLEDVAVAARTNASYVAEVERGEANIGIELLDKLARALGLKSADLFIEPKPGEKPPAPLKAGRRAQRPPAVRPAPQKLSDEGRHAILQRVPGSRITTPEEVAWMLDNLGAAARKVGNPHVIQLVDEVTDDFLATLKKHAKPPRPKEQTPERERGGRQRRSAEGPTRGRTPH